MEYSYRARNRQGEIMTGLVEAPTLEAAEKTLRSHSLRVLHLDTPKSFIELLGFGGRIKLKQRAFFTRQLATMVNAGLPLVQVLTLLGKSEKNKLLKRIVTNVREDLESGYSFSTSVAKYPIAFSRVFVNAVRAGESTGKLEVVLKELADTLEKDAATAASFRSMMIYPAFILTAMVAVGTLMMIKVIPVLASVFTEAEAQLPLATRLLIAVSNFAARFWWIILIILAALFVTLRAFFHTERGRRWLDLFKLRFYVIRNLTTSFLMARFSRTLGMLVAAGVPLLESINVTGDAMDNLIFKEALERAAIQVERGIALSVAISKFTFFPPLIPQMILVGEQTGELEKVLERLSKSYEEEYDTAAKGLSALIEPVIIILLGLGVAFMLFAILLPVYQASLLVS